MRLASLLGPDLKQVLKEDPDQVRDLLDDACTVIPALGEYEFSEAAAGLRPMTPDNLPIVGRLDERTLVAAGHGRSGFLLAPWTAETIAAELEGASVR